MKVETDDQRNLILTFVDTNELIAVRHLLATLKRLFDESIKTKEAKRLFGESMKEELPTKFEVDLEEKIIFIKKSSINPIFEHGEEVIRHLLLNDKTLDNQKKDYLKSIQSLSIKILKKYKTWTGK